MGRKESNQTNKQTRYELVEIILNVTFKSKLQLFGSEFTFNSYLLVSSADTDNFANSLDPNQAYKVMDLDPNCLKL